MKWVLIFVMFNTAQPNQPAALGHRTFTTEYECRDFAEHVIRDVERKRGHYKALAFCVTNRDLESD